MQYGTFFLTSVFGWKVLWLALLQCFFKRALWNFACVLIANGLWNCLLLSKCLKTHDITHTQKYWLGLIPFLPLILLVFFCGCRIVFIIRFFFNWTNWSCVGNSSPPDAKVGRDRLQTGVFLHSTRQTPPSPSLSALPPPLPPFRANFTHFFLRRFHSSRFLLAVTLNSRTLSYNFRCTVSPQRRLWRSDLQYLQNNIPHRNLFLLLFSAYAQKKIKNPSSALSRNSSGATELLNLGASPVSASRSCSRLHAIDHYILL